MSDVIVVSAAIVDVASKRILLAQRSGSTTYPYHWCTPGGKVEDGEVQVQALRRELREELGVTINIYATNPLYEHELPSSRTGKMVRVICFSIPSNHVLGTYMCGDGTAGLGWFDAAELAQLRLAPADASNRAALVQAIVGVSHDASDKSSGSIPSKGSATGT